MAAEIVIDKAENRFSLAPCIAGVDDFGNIFPEQQLFEQRKLFAIAGQRKQSEIRHQRERGKLPLLPPIVLWHTNADQMSQRIGNEKAVALIIRILPVLDALISADTVGDCL